MATERVPPARNGVVRSLTYLMFLLFALTSESVGVIIPVVISEFKLGFTVAGTFHYATMGGIALGGVLLGALADRIGPKPAILLGLLVFGVSSGLFAVNHHFGAFAVLLFIGGLAIGLFKTGALTLIGDISPTSTAHTATMNMAEGFFGIGAIIGPAIVAYLLSGGYSWKWLYVIAAGLCLAIAACALLVRFPPHRRPSPAHRTAIPLHLVTEPVVMGFSGAIMLYVGVETAIYVWMPTVLAGLSTSHAVLSTYALPVFFVLRALGRFVGSWLLAKMAWERVIALATGAIFLCFAVTLLDPDRFAMYLLPFSGIFMSVVYPTLNSKALSCSPPSQQGAVAGIVLFFTCVSAIAAPLAMGLLGDVFHNPIAGFQLSVGLALLLGVAGLLNLAFTPATARLKMHDRG